MELVIKIKASRLGGMRERLCDRSLDGEKNAAERGWLASSSPSIVYLLNGTIIYRDRAHLSFRVGGEG